MKALALLLLLVISPAFAASSASSASDAEIVFMQYKKGISENNWAIALSYMQPEELSRVRKVFVDSANDPDLQKAEAAAFPGQSASQIRAKSDLDYFASFFSAMIGAAKISNDSMTIIGTVMESDSIAYIVFRETFSLSGEPQTKVDLMTMTKIQGRWYVTMPKELWDGFDAHSDKS